MQIALSRTRVEPAQELRAVALLDFAPVPSVYYTATHISFRFPDKNDDGICRDTLWTNTGIVLMNKTRVLLLLYHHHYYTFPIIP